jgi:rhodanese-related sulfurtransferase
MPHNPRFKLLVDDANAQVKEISALEAAQKVSLGAKLIDVREADEYATGHAKDALPLSKGIAELRIEQVIPDAATPIICYCGRGSRSALVAINLQKMGYQNVCSLAGGFKGWKEAGLPIER